MEEKKQILNNFMRGLKSFNHEQAIMVLMNNFEVENLKEVSEDYVFGANMETITNSEKETKPYLITMKSANEEDRILTMLICASSKDKAEEIMMKYSDGSHIPVSIVEITNNFEGELLSFEIK
ncbi:hypothetical protein BFS06_13805 [Clostridium perfringens]|uniref:Uncharacterized protein n=1 Tax=Clostridium perfringens TaxID=1502 RepID=A0A140GRR0_CLOPF|nr:hypothetical protein [Clostridium perfringens]AMN31219.1 hypothetical protein JFP838_pA0303 [Clostridium perfringens]TBX14280.1 hypothetical protein BFS06_13805 [Clostridium perfringens]